MSQTRVNLASARRELAERKDEVALCLAELKAAQELMAAGGSGSKNFTVTVNEIFGAITVDRVAVRPEKAPAQEKVVVEGIPCKFMLEAGVEKFDVVLMAEHAAAPGSSLEPVSGATDGANENAVAGAEVAAMDGADTTKDGADAVTSEPDEVVISTADATEAVEAESAAVVVPPPPAAAAVGAVTTTHEAQAEDSGAAEEVETTATSSVVTEPAVTEVPEAGEAAVTEAEEGVDTVASLEAADATERVAETSPDASAETEAAATPTIPAGSDTSASGAKEPILESGSTPDGNGTGAEMPEAGEGTKQEGSGEVPSAGGGAAASAASLGCSTVTTEVVVPSSELDLKSSDGQWRYLEADATPIDGDDAVEVTKGVRFSTALEAQDSQQDEGRIVELTLKYEEAERRVRSAEAMVKKLQPAPAGTTSRKKSATGGANRKSALKKGKGGTRAVKSEGGKGRGVIGTLSAAVTKACDKAKKAGTVAWGARNLMFFVSAVAVMHLHGDYLAV